MAKEKNNAPETVKADAKPTAADKKAAAANAKAEKKAAAEKAKANKKPSVFVRFGRFCRDCIREMGKVIWPTGKQVFRNSSVVVVVIIAVAVSLAILDYGYSNAVFELQQLFKWIVPVIE